MGPNMTGFDALELCPDFKETMRRYEAFWNGDMIDRPIVRITAPNPGYAAPEVPDNYYTRIHDDAGEAANGILSNKRRFLHLGDSIPYALTSLGTDELAAFCGNGQLVFAEGVQYTNWFMPFVDDWEEAFPLEIGETNPLWLRTQLWHDKCAEVMCGKMLFYPFDTQTNMGMLAAMRGPERLCMDLIDCPEVVEKALEQTMGVFDKAYNRLIKNYNLFPGFYATMQSDFSCMVSTDMYRRYILPYLEREAEYFGRVYYHWDGPGALKHADAIIGSKNLYALGFVPGHGNGKISDYLELHQKVQKGGKAVTFRCDVEETKYLHKNLEPDKALYDTWVENEQEAAELLEWFVKNS